MEEELVFLEEWLRGRSVPLIHAEPDVLDSCTVTWDAGAGGAREFAREAEGLLPQVRLAAVTRRGAALITDWGAVCIRLEEPGEPAEDQEEAPGVRREVRGVGPGEGRPRG